MISAYMEDMPDIGIFTYRLKGFNSEPTDHYMRTWYVDAADHFRYNKPYCMGSMPRHKVSVVSCAKANKLEQYLVHEGSSLEEPLMR